MKINSLNKVSIAKNLTKKTGLSINLSKKLTNDCLDILIQLIHKENFIVKNFGTFKIIKKKKRTGRNPKSRQEFTISSRKSLSFITSKIFLESLNQNK